MDPGGKYTREVLKGVSKFLKFGAKLTPVGRVISTIKDYLVDTDPLTDDTVAGRRKALNQTPQPTSTPSQRSSPTPSPSPSPAPNPQPQNNPNCQQQPQKNPCSGQVLGGTFNQVKYSNRGTGSTPHHMPGWAAIKASGIALGQTKNYYYTKTPTACMSSFDHGLTPSFERTHESIYYVNKVSGIIRTEGFYDAQLEDIIELRNWVGNKYDQGILQMQNYTRNLMATEPQLFR